MVEKKGNELIRHPGKSRNGSSREIYGRDVQQFTMHSQCNSLALSHTHSPTLSPSLPLSLWGHTLTTAHRISKDTFIFNAAAERAMGAVWLGARAKVLPSSCAAAVVKFLDTFN